MGFFDAKNNLWDWLKCSIPYDGDVNTIARYYTVTDSYSNGPNTPEISGLDNIKEDKQQDWVID